jgi:hypothetical protein
LVDQQKQNTLNTRQLPAQNLQKQAQKMIKHQIKKYDEFSVELQYV